MLSPQDYAVKFDDHFGKLLGLKLVSISPDECLYEYNPTDEHHNPNGVLHGGALYSAMDSCQGALVHFTLDWDIENGTTAESTIRYRRPHRLGPIAIRSRIVERKRKIVYVETFAHNEPGELLAELHEKWMLLSK
ncbi:MAG: PaaI family thioesterase [Leptospirales bacterium]|nr:PaaI family thioesterase [Leptospirales bacterium]